LQEQTKKVDKNFELEVPGIMVIDTPGHESFNNLRKRGSSLCDLAILVIDIMHGLEPQTVESLELLKKRKCPFVIALNKVDVCYQWNSKTYTPIREALDRQEQFVRDEFRQRYDKVMLQLNERGLNVALYWENDDYRRNISIVPTSALTGEGVPDLLYMLINLSQNLMASKLEVEEELQCTVIEVKTIEGLGTTIDVILVNGTLREGDQIVLAGMGGPIVTTIRALLTPQPMKEMRVKSEYVHHAMINQSMGIKICAPGLEEAVAGTELQVVGPDDDIEELKDNVDDDFDSILNNFEKQGEGVYVKASTLGSLEALLDFLQSMKIPVFDVGIGEVFKKDVKKAMVMKEKKHPEYACILCFDVKVNAEAKQQATTDGVQIFTADIIYHLFDKFTQYMDKINADKKQERREEAVFPCVLEIDRNHVFMKKDPILFACTVVGGQLRKGTPICIPEKDNLEIGRVAGIEKDKKPVEKARKGDVVCVKIEQNTGQNHIAYGRHFDATNRLYSKVTRSSIDTLKENFRDEMNKEDWELMVGLKKVFQID
jgi:translation initiation factor aIF-2/yIF-2